MVWHEGGYDSSGDADDDLTYHPRHSQRELEEGTVLTIGKGRAIEKRDVIGKRIDEL